MLLTVSLGLSTLIAACGSSAPQSQASQAVGKRKVAGAEAQRLVKAGALLLDVRTVEEYRSGHLPDALNIPVAELAGRMGELSAKERPVVVYCQSGRRSANAASMLAQAGYVSVNDLGPMSAW